MDSSKKIDIALGVVADMDRYVRAGDEVLAAQARRTLEELVGNHADGYPAPVRVALERAGLRSTFGV